VAGFAGGAGETPAQLAHNREWESNSAIGFADGGRRDARPTLRLMEGPDGFMTVHWDN